MDTIKQKFLKVAFPFYSRQRHGFLMQKWWFRLLLVAYIIAFACLPFIIMNMTYEAEAGWCYDSLHLYYGDFAAFDREIEKCGLYAKEAQPVIWASGILGPLVIHYFIQLIFFKLIINFIVLGGKNPETEVRNNKEE